MNRASRIIAILACFAVLLTSCGVSSDASPREFSLDQIPTELRPGQLPTPTPERDTQDTSGEQIHMLRGDNRLRLVVRERAETPEDILRILVNGTFPQEKEEGITSAINGRTSELSIVGIDAALQLVTVDLAPGSLDPRNSEQRLAFAQIVFSLTSLPGIELVEFVQSDPDNPDAAPASLAVQRDSGTTLPGARVGRDDFSQLNPDRGAEPSFDIPIPTVVPETTERTPVTIWKVREVSIDDSLVEVVGEPIVVETSDGSTQPRLVGVIRQLEDISPVAVVENLLSGTPLGERNLGLRSAFPPDALVNGVTIRSFEVPRVDRDGVVSERLVTIAVVDLALGSLPDPLDGSELLLAAGQIVFTLTGLESIDEVVFSIDGQPVQMPTDNGLSAVYDLDDPEGLTRVDFALEAPGGYLWRPQPVQAVTPAPEATSTPSASTTTEDAIEDATGTDDSPTSGVQTTIAPTPVVTPTPSPTSTPAAAADG